MVRRCGFLALIAPLGLFSCADDPYGVDATAVGSVQEAEVGGGSGHVFTPVEFSDREALEALYHATDGPNWKRAENWLTDAPLREWHGIGWEWHDGEERVDRLLFGQQRAIGCAPSRRQSTGPADAPAPWGQPWPFRPSPGEHRQTKSAGIA